MLVAESEENDMKYPKYEVNGRSMRDWEDAQMYWRVYGGVLMEKIDAMTPWHVLCSSKKCRDCGVLGPVDRWDRGYNCGCAEKQNQSTI
jgi:hypothetical protein